MENKVPWYTNSSQLPVGFTDDLFEAVELQEPLQTKYSGGTVFHAFLGERLPSGKEAKILIKKVLLKSKMPYFSLTPTFSVCRDCGYIAGEHFECPTCGKEALVYSRIVGYITPVNQWNNGKTAEWKKRKEFLPKYNNKKNERTIYKK